MQGLPKYSATARSSPRQRLYVGRPWQVVSVDLVDSFTPAKKDITVILVMSYHFITWRDAIAVPNGAAEVVADILEHKVFRYLGFSEFIGADQGTRFESIFFSPPCEVLGVEESRTTPYYRQAKWVVARGNKDLGDALRFMLLSRLKSGT